MKKTTAISSIVAATLIFVFSCNKFDNSLLGGDKTVYLDLPDSVHSYANAGGNSTVNHTITLGRVLFYDRHLSLNNSISCGSCHKQALAFSDNTSLSRGFENKLTSRNTPPIQNLNVFMGGFSNTNLFWDGRETDIRHLITRPISNHVEMGIADLSTLPDKLAALPYYADLFTKAYGTSEITIDKIANAVALFTQNITASGTRLDMYTQGSGQLTALELQGMQLFQQKYDCAQCHNPSIGGYSSSQFMNIGLDAPYTDKGLGAISGNSADNGKFKIPNLRNVALTAPYMHDGRFKTLDDVLEHYSHGIKNDVNLDERLKDASGKPMQMNIPPQERQAIIAFLNTLTSVNMITDPYFSDPFKTK